MLKSPHIKEQLSMNSSLGSKTYDEISSQPDVWMNILNDSEKQLDKANPFSTRPLAKVIDVP
jgi:hypothetical protein